MGSGRSLGGNRSRFRRIYYYVSTACATIKGCRSKAGINARIAEANAATQNRAAGFANRRTNGSANGRTCGDANRRANGLANRSANGRASGDADGRANGLANRSANRRTSRDANRRANGNAANWSDVAAYRRRAARSVAESGY